MVKPKTYAWIAYLLVIVVVLGLTIELVTDAIPDGFTGLITTLTPVGCFLYVICNNRIRFKLSPM